MKPKSGSIEGRFGVSRKPVPFVLEFLMRYTELIRDLLAIWGVVSLILVGVVWRTRRQKATRNMEDQIRLYGFPDAATAFDQRHPQWSLVLTRLWQTINLAFTRRQTMDTPIDKFVYFYGNLVAEDFMELFLMAVNGYGFGAMKLLRSMYEHTIVLESIGEYSGTDGTFT